MPKDAARATPALLDPADLSPASRALLRDWLALQRQLALAPGRAAELLRRSGDPRAAIGRGSRANIHQLDADIEALCRSGCVALPLLSPLYPWRLANLADPPPLLSVRGALATLQAPSIAIVGARAATVYGLGVARQLAADFARAGVVVISGLALGIDAAAHRGALEGGGRTLAVLPCGLDRVYPASHRRLAAAIARDGALISELPLGMGVRRPFFALRNRLISGLASALVVVEARERSGSLITAGHAADQGIDVFAVPGPITAATSAGPNRLLRDGAGVALSAADVLEALGLAAVGGGPAAPKAVLPESGEQREILALLERELLGRDALGRRLGRAPEVLAADLLELELGGWIAEDRDGRLRVRRSVVTEAGA